MLRSLIVHVSLRARHSMVLSWAEIRCSRVIHTMLRRVVGLILSGMFVLFLAHVGSILSVWYFLVYAIIVLLVLATCWPVTTRILATPLSGSACSFSLAFQHEWGAWVAVVFGLLIRLQPVQRQLVDEWRQLSLLDRGLGWFDLRHTLLLSWSSLWLVEGHFEDGAASGDFVEFLRSSHWRLSILPYSCCTLRSWVVIYGPLWSGNWTLLGCLHLWEGWHQIFVDRWGLYGQGSLHGIRSWCAVRFELVIWWLIPGIVIIFHFRWQMSFTRLIQLQDSWVLDNFLLRRSSWLHGGLSIENSRRVISSKMKWTHFLLSELLFALSMLLDLL